VIKVKFVKEYRESILMLPAVPRVSEIVAAPDGILGRVSSVTWRLSDPDDIFVKIIID
jgi:hypothetical protein